MAALFAQSTRERHAKGPADLYGRAHKRPGWNRTPAPDTSVVWRVAERPPTIVKIKSGEKKLECETRHVSVD